MDYNTDDIYKEYFHLIHGRVHKSVPESDVDDVVQDVWIAILGGIAGFREESGLGTWIYNITSYKIYDCYRRHSRGLHNRQKLEDANWLLMRKSSPAKWLDDSIPSLMSRLPESYADIIQKIYVDGRDFAEIAKEEDKKYETVRSMHRRAIRYIKKHELVERV